MTRAGRWPIGLQLRVHAVHHDVPIHLLAFGASHNVCSHTTIVQNKAQEHWAAHQCRGNACESWRRELERWNAGSEFSILKVHTIFL